MNAVGRTAILLAALLWLLAGPATAEDSPALRIETRSIRQGFDGKTCWVHARAGAIPPGAPGNPSERPLVVMTMQKLLLSGSDIFYGLHMLQSRDDGATWTEPAAQPTLARRRLDDGTEEVLCDFTPKWHAATGRLLGTGHTALYRDNKLVGVRRRQTGYSVYDAKRGVWSEWRALEMPKEPQFENAGAGSVQWVGLPDGDILLPVYFKQPEKRQYSVAVVRCRFDGKTLRYVEHGNEMTVDVQRGFAEPSLARVGGRYYLTLRNDVHGYVTSGDDGLHFDRPRLWTFDDGTGLGNYNTQQHWVTHGDDLYLVYTRRGANNDHVFRNRAPLFIARVDRQRLCVIRSTEQIVVPEHGARLGNFAVCEVGPDETWVTVTEWMQPRGVEKYGSDNRVYVGKILWK